MLCLFFFNLGHTLAFHYFLEFDFEVYTHYSRSMLHLQGDVKRRRLDGPHLESKSNKDMRKNTNGGRGKVEYIKSPFLDAAKTTHKMDLQNVEANDIPDVQENDILGVEVSPEDVEVSTEDVEVSTEDIPTMEIPTMNTPNVSKSTSEIPNMKSPIPKTSPLPLSKVAPK